MPLRFTCSSRSRLLAALLALAAPGGVGVTAQPQFAAKTEAVLVDVIVADGQRRFVSGLAAHDFAILENGVRQEIVSFVEVAPAAVATASSRTAATAAAPRARRGPGWWRW